jgi:DNA-binding NarL/FixJ family response regulator
LKKILYVGHDKRVFSAVRSRLRQKRSVWDVQFAEGEEQARKLLSFGAFDVVICDVRTSGDGAATLLTELREVHPGTVRLVVSGQLEVPVADRTHLLAHRLLRPPFDGNGLQRAIERSLVLKEVLADPGLDMVMATIARLQPSAAERDQAAGTTELPAGGTAAPTAEAARGRFGKAGVLMTRVLDAVGRGAGDDVGLGVEDRIRHGWATASLAHAMVFPGESADSAYLAGWLHDVGELVLLASAPARMRATAREALDAGRPRHEVEREHLGVTHAEVGALLLDRWDLPHAVTEAVAHHHAPSRVVPDGLDAVAAVHAANALLADGVAPGEWGLEETLLDRVWLRRAGLVARIPTWRVLAAGQARGRD